MANASPEPFSNWILSVSEDLLVVGLGFLALKYPIAALVVAGSDRARGGLRRRDPRTVSGGSRDERRIAAVAVARWFARLEARAGL